MQTKIDKKNMTITISLDTCCMETLMQIFDLKTEKELQEVLDEADMDCCRKLLKKKLSELRAGRH